MKQNKDYIGIILLSCFLILLSYAGYLSMISIDWDVLKRLESAPIALPSIAPATPATTATPTATKK